MDTTAADHLLSTTRAVRKRLDLDRPVERDVILECLRLAIQAPTGANAQGWRWLVVTDPEVRRGLAEIYRKADSGLLARRSEKLRETDPQTSRVYSSAAWFAENLERVPVHVIPCVEGRAEGMPTVVSASLYGSILPAVWSFMLALRSRGLGSVWTTLHLAFEQDAAALLGVPEGFTQVALVPVAYTVGTDFKPASRRPVEEVTYWDHWGDS